jgi:hypothetical protein
MILEITYEFRIVNREPTSGLEPLIQSLYEFACARPSPYWYVRFFGLFMQFSTVWRSHFVHCVPASLSPAAVQLQYVRRPRYRVRQDGLEEQVVVEGLNDLASDKIVGVNLLMAQEVVIFLVVRHFTRPLQVFLAGFRLRPAGLESVASKSGCL